MPKSRRRTLLSDFGETRLIDEIISRFKRQRHHALVLGPGDDAALIAPRPGRVLVLTHDDLVEGSHFETRWADFAKLGAKLLRINLSDLAAMGEARPLGVLVSAGFPSRAPLSWARSFLDGLAAECRLFKTPVLGGNLARSEKIFLGMTAVGEAGPSAPLRRGTARAGDLLCGIGPLGLAGQGLRELRTGRKSSPAISWFWKPEPQFEAAALLARRNLATALMDNSDGLARSAEELARASGLSYRLDLSQAPLQGDPDAGEDYGLVFAVRPSKWPAVRKALPRAYPLGVLFKPRGAMKSSPAVGFDHFLSKK